MSAHYTKLIAKSSLALLLLFGISTIGRTEVVQVDNTTLQELMSQGVQLIDVRRLEEWQETGVVEGSTRETFFDEKGNYDANKWLGELQELANKDQPVALICWTGVRSNVIANWLSNGLGYKTVYNVKKGIKDWIGDELPVVQ